MIVKGKCLRRSPSEIVFELAQRDESLAEKLARFSAYLRGDVEGAVPCRIVIAVNQTPQFHRARGVRGINGRGKGYIVDSGVCRVNWLP